MMLNSFLGKVVHIFRGNRNKSCILIVIFIFHPLVGKIIASFWSISHMTLIIVVYFCLFLFEVYCLDCNEVTHPDNCTTTTACGYEKVCQNYISTKTKILIL